MARERTNKELHPETRDKLIGFKVTETEYKEILDFCKDKGVSVSRYARYVVKQSIEK